MDSVNTESIQDPSDKAEVTLVEFHSDSGSTEVMLHADGAIAECPLFFMWTPFNLVSFLLIVNAKGMC